MNNALIGHDKPVDSLAARLFWRAPWWAKCPEETKREIAEVVRENEKHLVDYFKDPPPPIGPYRLRNRKGELIFWPEGNPHLGAKPRKLYLITGFAHRARRGSSWWVLIEGHFMVVNSAKLPNRMERF